jgi:hypothetical protein
MPNQPAPPAPTPTMGESIAWIERRVKDSEREASLYPVDGADREMLLEEAAHYRVALSAMRAVEAMQQARIEVRIVPAPDRITSPVWFRVTLHEGARRAVLGEFHDVTLLHAINQALAAFPSPDGGSAK